jgi:outer membrane receptor for ferrienterochelin and colicin
MKKFPLFCAAAALAMPVAAYAQQITTTIEGQVTTETGEPVSGATVTITDTRTGQEQTVTTGADGRFSARGLTTGGPYTVTGNAPGFQGQAVQQIFTSLQGATTLTLALSAAATAADEQAIVVTGARAGVQLRAIGPGQAFGTESLEAFPSITRDIRDIIRIDPRVSLDRSNEVDRISCLGGNDRANTFTVDGIIQADVFGLNGTPFAARNALPLPFDAIRETSVEFAPFDVQYGQFTGCAINVVTRGGTNEFRGSAFFTFNNQDLQGSELDGERFETAPFEEKRYGAAISGPILRDRLFFSFAYEKTELSDVQDRGPVGGGYANDLGFVTVEQFNDFSNIVSSIYGIDTGGLPRILPETSTRYFGRLDWVINDQHRLEGTYQRLEETNTEEDDISNSNFAGLNTFEEEGTISNYYSSRLYSNWTDDFTTELRVSRAEVQDVQGPVGGGEAQSDNPIPRIIVGVQNGTSIGTLQAGPGFSRTSNELDTTIDQARFSANLQAGDHSLTFGVEVNRLKVFNLFAQNSTGTLTFNNLADLREGLLSGGTNTFPNAAAVLAGQAAGAYGNFTASGDINEAAAEFKRTIYTAYAQDEWALTPQFDLLAGVRVDWFDGGAPRRNPNFEQRYGFTNATPFSRLDVLVLPRLALTYDLENEGFFNDTQVRGGVGIFSGGDPVVYFSNAFSNNGFSTGFGQTGRPSCGPTGTRIDVVTGGQFTGIPACIRTDGGIQSARGLGDTQSTDPNFKSPTVLRANLGLVSRFGDGSGGIFDDWRLNLDYIYSRFRNPLNFVDLSQTIDIRRPNGGFTTDGRPIYAAIDPTVAGCNARLVGTGGTPPVYTNVTPACFNTSRDDEIQLTNGPGYNSHVASVILSKSFPGFTEGGNARFNLGYAFTDADNNRYNASSTATSSYDIVAAFDRQNPAIATSEYQTRHNISLALNLREKFFADLNTSLGFVFIARSGRPYSLTFNNGGVFNDSASGVDNALLYIPSGMSDPNVSPLSDPAAVQSLVDYANSLDCARGFIGRSIERNSCRNNWFYDLDLRFSQELPGPGRLFGLKDRFELFADFDNFLNLLDSGWNTFRNRDYAVEIVDLGLDLPGTANDIPPLDNQGRYVIRNFNPQDEPITRTSSSVWRIQLGIRYEF